MLKESQWAHNFANSHFGSPDSDFGAQQRFIGVMVNLLAMMQGQYAMQELAGPDTGVTGRGCGRYPGPGIPGIDHHKPR